MVIIPGIEVDEERLAAICDKYGIAELRVFGSRARRRTPDVAVVTGELCDVRVLEIGPRSSRPTSGLVV
jgi:hypothetical protein